jgi:uncharacterized protein YhjY with autotransporter beta-barrel domain
MNAEHSTDRPHATRVRAFLWLMLFTVGLAASGLASATGCRLEFSQTSPIALLPGTATTLLLSAADAGSGACTAASFNIVTLSDTTAGTALTPLTGTAMFGGGPVTLNVTAPSSAGGSVTWQAICASGCEATNPPNPTFTVNIGVDVYAMNFFNPAGGIGAVNGGETRPFSVRLLKNGLPAFAAGENQVCFEFTAGGNPEGATLSGGSGPCGNGGRLVQADNTGTAQALLVSAPGMCTQTRVRATAIGFPVPQTLEVRFDGQTVPVMNAVNGSGQSTPAGTAFASPLSVALACPGRGPLTDKPVRWDRINNTNIEFAGGLPSIDTVTDAAGLTSVSVTALAATGTTAARACLEPNCTVSVTLPLTVLPVAVRALAAQGLTQLEVAPGTSVPVSTLAQNDGVAAPNTVVNWAVVGGSAVLGGAATSANANGVASNSVAASPSAGTAIIRATRNDAPASTVDFTLDIPVYSLLDASQGNPTVTVPQGQQSTLAVQVQRQTAATQNAPGRLVSFAVSSGPGPASLQPVSGGLSDNNGIAAVQFSSSAVGLFTIEASFSPGPGFPPSVALLQIEVTGSTSSLRIVEAPEILFTDETTAGGIRVRALRSGQTGLVGAAGIQVVVLISQGFATFAEGSALVQMTTDEDGYAQTSPISVGRSTAPLEFEIRATGRGAQTLTRAVTPSIYRLQAQTPTQSPRIGEPVVLRTILTRQGSAQAVALANAEIDWSSSGGSVTPARSRTDATGTAVTRFIANAAGDQIVTARLNSAPQSTPVEARFLLSPAGKSLQIVSGDAQTAAAGAALPFPVVVEASEAGTPQAGVAVNLTVLPEGSARVSPTEAVTGNDGRASFNVVLSPNARGDLRLLAERVDARIQANGVVRVGTPPRVRSLEASAGNGQTARPGQLLAAPLQVLALNDGAAASGVPISFSVSPLGAAVVEPAAATTGADGRLAVQVRLGAEAQGSVRINAARSDDPGAVAEFTVFAGGSGGEQRLEIDSGNNQSGLAGTRANELVVRYTLNGLAATDVPVQWSVLEGPAVLDAGNSRTDSQGRARIGLRVGDSAGSSRIRARANELDVLFSVSSFEGQLQLISGSGQTGAPGAALEQPLRVRLLPQAIAGVQIQWRVLSGGGQISSASSLTSANGEAETRWTLGSQAGRQTVGARLSTGAEVVFEASAQAIDSELEIVAGNGQLLAIGGESEPLVVRVRDSAGLVQAGRTVRWSADNALLSADTTQTDAQGRAQIRARLRQPGEARIRASLQGDDSQVSFVLNGGLVQISGLNPRQRSVATALDRACPALVALSARTPQQQDLFERCGDLIDAAGDDRPGLLGALDQLPNDVGLNLARAGDEALRGQVANLDQRLRALRSEGGGANRVQVGLGLSTPNGMLPLSALPALALAVGEDDVNQEIGEGFERWGAFLTGSFGRGRSRQPSLNPEFDYSLGSLTAGVDYRFSDKLVAGLALGLSRDDTDLANSRGQLESRGTSLSAYASLWLPRDWYLDANLSRGTNSFDMHRNILFELGGRRVQQTATASTDADLLGGSLSFGRDWNHRAWGLGAYLRAQFSRVEYDPFEEQLISGRSGEGLGLHVESPRWNSREAVLGSRASYVMSRDWGVLMPNILLEYSREFSDDPSRLDLRFLADPTRTVFSQSGGAIDQSYLNLGLGVSALFPGGRSAFLQYERRLLDDRINHWLLSFGGRIEF